MIKHFRETDVLDVTFNFNTNRYFLYFKTNNDPLYINMLSNHPNTGKKELPKLIYKRLSELSCSKKLKKKKKKN